MIKLLYDATNQPSKFITRNWVEINDESQGVCNDHNENNNTDHDNNNIKLKTSMIRSGLYNYSDAYILAKEL